MITLQVVWNAAQLLEEPANKLCHTHVLARTALRNNLVPLTRDRLSRAEERKKRCLAGHFERAFGQPGGSGHANASISAGVLYHHQVSEEATLNALRSRLRPPVPAPVVRFQHRAMIKVLMNERPQRKSVLV